MLWESVLLGELSLQNQNLGSGDWTESRCLMEGLQRHDISTRASLLFAVPISDYSVNGIIIRRSKNSSQRYGMIGIGGGFSNLLGPLAIDRQDQDNKIFQVLNS